MAQKSKHTFTILFSFILAVNIAQAQEDTVNNLSIVWTKANAYTPIHVALPDNYNPKVSHTLIIGLHGYGGTAENFMGLSKPFTDAGFIFAAPEALYPVPHDDGNMGYEWFLYDISSFIMLERPASEKEKAAMRLTTEQQMGNVIRDLKERYNVDHIYFTGFSQGGIITYLTGIHHHDKIDGMIIFASVVDKDWLGSDNIEEGNKVRTLIIQGTQDKLVPIELAENGRDLLLKNGYDVTYRNFEGGHTVPMELLDFVIDWVNKK